MTVRDDYTAPDPGTRSTSKFYGIDAHEHAAAINAAAVDSTVVHKTGTETIAGAKTFTSDVAMANVKDTNGNYIMAFSPDAGTVVNNCYIENAATGHAPAFGATGSDTDVGLNLKTKGAGRVTNNAVAIPTVSSTDTLTNKTLTAPVVNSPTGIVKADVGLGNVDNTSNATERAAAATLTNKTLTAPTLTTPVLGTPASGNLANCTFPTLNQNTSGTAANVTGTVAIANGGTGATTLAGAGILVSGGALGTPASGNASNLTSFPTLNQNTTGTASNVTGTVAIANGGTGATTLAGAAITVGSNNGTATGLTLWKGTAAQYTALGSGRPSTTIYIVTP